MTLLVRSVLVIVFISAVATSAAAQQPASDQARQNTVVKDAMRSYQSGLTAIKEAAEAAAQPGTSSGAIRELTLESAVALALEKNLDIQVSRL